MPERYKKRILQRPGHETQSVTERPSEFYQLELPDFKIPTVTNSEDSIITGLTNRKARDAYNQAYNEYLEQYPVSTWSKIAHSASSGPMFPGDASFSNFALDPTNTTKEDAYKYAVEKSGYGPQNPNDFWRTIDQMRDETALGASLTVNTLPALITAANGTFGIIPKLAADLKFGYDGYKGLTSPEGWTKTKNFWNEGRYGRAALSGLGDALDLGLVIGPTIKPVKGLLNKYGKETIDALKFNLNNKGIGFRMDYPWQVRSNSIPSGTVFSGADVPALQSINQRMYQSPSASQLEMIPQVAYASNIQKQSYQRPQTNLTPLKEVFGDSLNIPDMVDFYRGSKPMLFADMRDITSDPNFTYFQGLPFIDYNRPKGGTGRFYINEDRLKQTIEAYKDLYTSRLNLPNTATVDDVYNHILSNPAKIDPALNKAEDIQDILGLSLGYGIKDAMLFKDPYLLDLDGTYKETVPGIFDTLSKRMNLKQLKREHGTFNGNHATWKFRTSALDDWKTKDKPKINLLSLNEDLPRESTPMWKRVGSIIRKAQSDLDAMNSYHIQNVEEWNKLNGKNFKPTTFRTDVGMSKILSKKDFINWIKQRKTNGPSDDVERVGAMYSPYEDTVYLRDDGISSGAYHEFLHQGQYGMRNPQVTLWRIGQLVDPKKIESLNPRQAAYYLSEQELPVHLRQMGENANINVGDPYPGDAEFDELLTKYPIFGSALFLKEIPQKKNVCSEEL